jgi:hypothetical protein
MSDHLAYFVPEGNSSLVGGSSSRRSSRASQVQNLVASPSLSQAEIAEIQTNLLLLSKLKRLMLSGVIRNSHSDDTTNFMCNTR